MGRLRLGMGFVQSRMVLLSGLLRFLAALLLLLLAPLLRLKETTAATAAIDANKIGEGSGNLLGTAFSSPSENPLAV